MKRANPASEKATEFRDIEFNEPLENHAFYLERTIQGAHSSEERKALYQATIDIEANGEQIVMKTLELFRAKRLVKRQAIQDQKSKVPLPEGCDNSGAMREANAEKLKLDNDAELRQLETLIVEVKDFLKTMPNPKRSASLMFSRN